MPSLKIQPYESSFCVPAALAIILDVPLEEAEKLLNVELGDQEVQRRLFYPIILKIIKEKGYSFTSTLSTNDLNATYLLCFNGHVGVLEANIYYDNQNPNGISTIPKKYKLFNIYQIRKPIV